MLAIAIGIAMSVLDSAVANIALPVIAADFHADPAEAVWVVNAYQVAVVMALLPLASLGERIGYRSVYLAGLAVFTAGSVACALSMSLPMLIAARVVQGLGAAGVFAVNGALVRFTYPQDLLGRGIGLNAFVVSRLFGDRAVDRLGGAGGRAVAMAVLDQRADRAGQSRHRVRERCPTPTARVGRSIPSAQPSMRSPSACSSSASTRSPTAAGGRAQSGSPSSSWRPWRASRWCVARRARRRR